MFFFPHFSVHFRYKEFPLFNKTFKGPVLEHGFYAVLSSLKELQRVTMTGLPLVIARSVKKKTKNLSKRRTW